MTKLDRILKSRHITLLIKICLAKVMFFSSSHVWMWLLDYKESWVLKNWCFWTVVLEKTFESPLDDKTQPVHPKGNQSWIFLGRTDAEAPILWPSDAKNWLIAKDPDAGKNWRPRRRGRQRMRGFDGWHHRLNGLSLSNFLELKMDRKLSPNHRNSSWSSILKRRRRRRWIGNSGMLHSMGLQRVRHNGVTELTEHTLQLRQPKISSDLSGVSGEGGKFVLC